MSSDEPQQVAPRVNRIVERLLRQPQLSLDLDDLDSPRIELWSTSPERDWYLRRRPRVYIFVVIGVSLLALSVTMVASNPYDNFTWFTGTPLSVLGLVVLGWCTVPYWAARRAFAERKKAMAAYRVDRALASVCAEDSANLSLNGLFELNRRQLDEYQQMTKRQQHLAFTLTWAAIACSFVVLIVGTILTLRAPTATSQVVVGSLSGLGIAVSGFLGRSFFESHRDAMRQLNYYYYEPFVTGRVLAAERLAVRLTDEDDRALASEMIQRLLDWNLPQPTMPSTTPPETPLKPSL